MRLYELVLVLRPSLSDADRKKTLKTVKDWLKDVTVAKEEEWGQKPLAYKIKKELAGHFTRLFLETDPSTGLGQKSIVAIESRLLQEVNVIRHLLLRTK